MSSESRKLFAAASSFQGLTVKRHDVLERSTKRAPTTSCDKVLAALSITYQESIDRAQPVNAAKELDEGDLDEVETKSDEAGEPTVGDVIITPIDTISAQKRTNASWAAIRGAHKISKKTNQSTKGNTSGLIHRRSHADVAEPQCNNHRIVRPVGSLFN